MKRAVLVGKRRPARTRAANGRLVCLALAMAVALLGCGEAGRRESDGDVAGTPRRIVSMAPALTEILFALGLGDRVVGVTTYCDYPPEARALARIGGFVNPSVEAILALEPDLVLVSPAAGNNPPVGSALGFAPFVGGEAIGNDFFWPEVGIITLTPSVGDAS